MAKPGDTFNEPELKKIQLVDVATTAHNEKNIKVQIHT